MNIINELDALAECLDEFGDKSMQDIVKRANARIEYLEKTLYTIKQELMMPANKYSSTTQEICSIIDKALY